MFYLVLFFIDQEKMVQSQVNTATVFVKAFTLFDPKQIILYT